MIYERYPGELYHFGIKGMKWGFRKKTNSGNKKSASKSKNDKDRANKTKKRILIGAGVTAGLVAGSLAAVKIANYSKLKKMAEEQGIDVKEMRNTIREGKKELKNNMSNVKKEVRSTAKGVINNGRSTYKQYMR